MKTLLIAAALSTSVAADELVVNLASHHINSVFQYNEVNSGIGYRWKHGANDWYLDESEIGFYRNSYHNTNAYDADGIGYSAYIKTNIWSPYKSKYLAINADFGVAVYGDDGLLPVVPILQITADISVTRYAVVKVGYTPLPMEVSNIKENGDVETDMMYGILTLSAGYIF